MRAIEYDEYGDPGVLHLRERAQPEPNPKETLIRVAACSVNPVDWRIRRGEMRYLLPGGFPRVPGFDVAGTVVSAPAASHLRPGDRVHALLDHFIGGAYAEFAICGPDVVAKIPDDLSFEDAAAIPLAASTALQSLIQHGDLQRGQHVIVTGASGGVGTFAVQIAKVLGAVVTGVASGKNRELVQSLGADHFIDYQTEKIADVGLPCHLFFDAAGKTSLGDVNSILREDGRFVSTEPDLYGLAMSLVTRVFPGRTYRTMLVKANRRDLEKMTRLYGDGLLRIVRNETFPLEQAADAHRHGEAGHGVGKIVLRVTTG